MVAQEPSKLSPYGMRVRVSSPAPFKLKGIVMSYIHPCKNCLVRACCQNDCSLFKKHEKLCETGVYSLGGFLTFIILFGLPILFSMFFKHHIIMSIVYFGIFYISFLVAVIQNYDEYKKRLNWKEKIGAWVIAPYTIVFVSYLNLVDKINITQFINKYNPHKLF